MKKIITLYCLLLLSQTKIIAQSANENLQKYWWYRYTLVNDFMTVGENCGDGIIGNKSTTMASAFNHPIYGNVLPGVLNIQLSCAQAPLQLGYYMDILATEYKMQKNAGLNTDRTLEEIYYAIKTIIRLDLTGEAHCRDYDNTAQNCGNVEALIQPKDLNGFFIRDDVYENYYNDHKKHYNQKHTCEQIEEVNAQGNCFLDSKFTKTVNDLTNNNASFANGTRVGPGLTWSQTYTNNVPKYPEEESQDMLSHVYGGLALLTYFLDGTENINGFDLKKEAQDELLRIMLYTNSNQSIVPFTIKNPVSVVNYYPINSGCVYGDKPYTWGNVGTVDNQCDNGGAYITASAFPMSVGLQNINATYNSNQWQDEYNYQTAANGVPKIIYQNFKYTSSGEAYFPTLYTCFSKTWTMANLVNVSRNYINRQSAKYEFRYPALPLIYRIIHGGKLFDPKDNKLKGIKNYHLSYEELLDKAPRCNPWRKNNPNPIPGINDYIYADYEWSAENRLSAADKRGQFWQLGEFAGYDYMLLFNLYALNTDYLSNTSYLNYYYAKEFNYTFPNGTTGTSTAPYKGQFLEYLSSRSNIQNNGNAEYRCGKSIQLLPGFKSENGSVFKAFIKDYRCCGYTDKEQHLLPTDDENDLFNMNNSLGEHMEEYLIPDDGIEDYEPTEEEEKIDSLYFMHELENSNEDYALDFLYKLKDYKNEVKTAMKIGIGVKKYNDQNNNLYIYPNPSTGIYHIESEMQILNVIAYNSLGNRVLCNYNIDNRTISIEGNAKGTYTFQLITANESFYRKVILE